MQTKHESVANEWVHVATVRRLDDQALGIVDRLGSGKYCVAQYALPATPDLIGAPLGS